ncbi:MAG: T9SS type A sorting domain-containing protein, partial [Polaribacter sp.]
LFHSLDAGATFKAIQGNLKNGSYSPAFRDVEIVITNTGNKIYFLATTMGLFSTNFLRGNSTVWKMESPDLIGTSIVSSLAYRADDQMLAVGTFGRGIFMGKIDAASLSVDTFSKGTGFSIYPNPSKGKFQILTNNAIDNGATTVTIFDVKGTLIKQQSFNNTNELKQFKFDLSTNTSGTYLVKLKSGQKTLTEKLLLQNISVR